MDLIPTGTIHAENVCTHFTAWRLDKGIHLMAFLPHFSLQSYEQSLTAASVRSTQERADCGPFIDEIKSNVSISALTGIVYFRLSVVANYADLGRRKCQSKHLLHTIGAKTTTTEDCNMRHMKIQSLHKHSDSHSYMVRQLFGCHLL